MVKSLIVDSNQQTEALEQNMKRILRLVVIASFAVLAAIFCITVTKDGTFLKCVHIEDKEIFLPADVTLADRSVNVVLLVDNHAYKETVNLISSIYTNTKSRVNLYMGLCNIEPVTVRSYLSCFSIQNFDPQKIKFALLNHTWRKEINFDAYSKLRRNHRQELVTCGNYMRFFLPRMFPGVDKFVYVDTDMIVQGDIAELDYYTENMNTTMAVTKRRNLEFKLYDAFPEEEIKAEYKKYHTDQELDMMQTSFCNGILVIDMKRWEKNFDEIMRRVNFWIDVAVKHSKQQGIQRWWERPTQSLMQLVFNNDYIWIPDRNWHSEGLGYISKLCDKHLIVAKLLHWNGHYKPWSTPWYTKYWSAFTPVQCQGHGSCRRSLNPYSRSESEYGCLCTDGFTGDQCQFADNKNYNPFV